MLLPLHILTWTYPYSIIDYVIISVPSDLGFHMVHVYMVDKSEKERDNVYYKDMTYILLYYA